jgi:hypothetical protein
MYCLDKILQLADSRLNPHRVRGWGLKAYHAKRLKEREENSKQKRMVAKSSLDEQLLQNLRRGTLLSHDLASTRGKSRSANQRNLSLMPPPPPEA